MVKIEGSKSAKWYAAHCCICKKQLRPQQARVNGMATMMDDSVVKVIYCEPCAIPLPKSGNIRGKPSRKLKLFSDAGGEPPAPGRLRTAP